MPHSFDRPSPHALPLTNPHYTLLSCTIFHACLTSKPLFFKQSFTVSVHLFRGQPTEQLFAYSSYINPLNNPVIFHSLHMAEPPESTFINPFVTLRNSLMCSFRTLCILVIPSKPLGCLSVQT